MPDKSRRVVSKRIFLLVSVFLCVGIVHKGVAGDHNPEKISYQEERLVSLIKKVKPSIIAVGTYYYNDIPKLQFYGTGFAVGDGSLIVTNAHVVAKIEEDKKINFLRAFHQGFEAEGKKAILLEKDETHDLAVLKVQGVALSPLEVGDSSTVMEGEGVAFTGYPLGLILGLNPTTHTGIISAISPIVMPSATAQAIKKDIVAFLRHPYDIFQIDATAYPGNSGSPVCRVSDGKIIGVINMVFVKEKKEHILKEPTGITYAIPVNYVRSMIEGLKQKQ